MYHKSMDQVQTNPFMAKCNGGAISMNNMPSGDYYIRVVNFGTPAGSHKQIYKLRTHAANEKVELFEHGNPY